MPNTSLGALFNNLWMEAFMGYLWIGQHSTRLIQPWTMIAAGHVGCIWFRTRPRYCLGLKKYHVLLPWCNFVEHEVFTDFGCIVFRSQDITILFPAFHFLYPSLFSSSWTRSLDTYSSLPFPPMQNEIECDKRLYIWPFNL